MTIAYLWFEYTRLREIAHDPTNYLTGATNHICQQLVRQSFEDHGLPILLSTERLGQAGTNVGSRSAGPAAWHRLTCRIIPKLHQPGGESCMRLQQSTEFPALSSAGHRFQIRLAERLAHRHAGKRFLNGSRIAGHRRRRRRPDAGACEAALSRAGKTTALPSSSNGALL